MKSSATSKFLRYNVRNVLLTSATHDHTNIFPTHADYLAPFRVLLSSLPSHGILVANSNEPHARSLADETGRATIFYALGDRAHWRAEKIERDSSTGFDLVRGSEKIIRLSTQLLGNHNIENIVGVGAMLLEKELLSPNELCLDQLI
jgi:UDP-N-acetylmuramate: L-alanyl-gamma-D-glutamyl-meso-diaminopimelate ligase